MLTLDVLWPHFRSRFTTEPVSPIDTEIKNVLPPFELPENWRVWLCEYEKHVGKNLGLSGELPWQRGRVGQLQPVMRAEMDGSNL